MAIGNVRTEPGVFSQFKPVRTFPVTPGGARVVALIGKGKVTNRANGEVLTRGGVADTEDVLANVPVSLEPTLVDEDLNTYNITDDFVLGGAGVAWTPSAVATLTGTIAENYNMTGNVILKITVGGTAEQVVNIGDIEFTIVSVDSSTELTVDSTSNMLIGDTITQGINTAIITNIVDDTNLVVDDTTGFTATTATATHYASSAAATATEVAAVIDANFTGLDSALDVDKVKVSTTATNNSSLLIGDGDANIILGFSGGSFLQTPREPAAGKTYQITYDYAKVAGDYVPRFFFSQSSVIDEHGDVSAVNTLSHGAEIVYQQGASIVALIQCDPADGAELTQFRNALTKLENVEGINIVVPLTTDENLYANVVSHVNNMSSTTERKERTAILAVTHPKTPQEIATQALAIANKRIVLHNITEADRFIGNDLTASTLDGSFVAAALAGVRVSPAFDIADPLTRKDIAGFNEIRPNNLLRSERVFMLDKGVCVLNEESGVNRVVQGITTDISTIENQEYSVVEIIDFVASNMRRVLESIYVGQKILTGTTSQVKSTVQAVLGNLVTSEVITAFQSVQASINNTDPTQIDVSFEIAPVFPLNFILITFSLAPNQ